MTHISRRQALRQSTGALALAALGGSLGGLALAVPARAAGDPWRAAQRIVDGIVVPRFADRDFAITDFGASPGADRNALPAVAAAIDACHAAGGRRVIVPEGLWVMDGPIHFKSNVNLHLQDGAHVRFSGRAAAYLPVVLTRWEGTEVYNYSPFIYGRGLDNVAITGPGRIDGQGAANFLPWRPKQKPDQRLLRQMGHDGVPVEQRVFGDGHLLRPHFIQFFDCRAVLIDGPTIVDSPFWVVHPVYCDHVVVRNITVLSGHINSDGVDPDSSSNVLIENCTFDVGDDGVAIKSGRDQDGWRVGRPATDIVVRNCRYSGGTGGGVAIGSEMSGGVRRVYIEDWDIPKAHHALYFKANLDRGGLIEDVHIRNIRAGRTDVLVIFTNDYHSYRGGTYPPRFERVTFQDVVSDQTRVGVHITGHPTAPVRDVLLRNIAIGRAELPVEIRHVENVSFDRVMINGVLYNDTDTVPQPAAGTIRH